MSSRVSRLDPWTATARTSTTWRFATGLRSSTASQHTTCSVSDHTASRDALPRVDLPRRHPSHATPHAAEQVSPSSPNPGARRQDVSSLDNLQARPSVLSLVSALGFLRRVVTHSQALRHTAIAPTRCAATNDTTHLRV
jgi:hypothetical protein